MASRAMAKFCRSDHSRIRRTLIKQNIQSALGRRAGAHSAAAQQPFQAYGCVATMPLLLSGELRLQKERPLSDLRVSRLSVWNSSSGDYENADLSSVETTDWIVVDRLHKRSRASRTVLSLRTASWPVLQRAPSSCIEFRLYATLRSSKFGTRLNFLKRRRFSICFRVNCLCKRECSCLLLSSLP